MTASARTAADVVTVIGAGMAGVACAVGLARDGVPVRLLERGRAAGGRMASPLLHGRRVDIGAGYFTVRDAGFRAVVDGWQAAGLARPWTDTFGILELGEAARTTTGPVRWATPGGLRSLVRQVLGDLEVEVGLEPTELPDGTVVLAMPDPQAARLLSVPAAVEYTPVITLVAGFDRRQPLSDADVEAAFVHSDPSVGFIADDGARRGDGAPVLVVHSTADLARRHLSEPGGATPVLVGALRELVGCPEPVWTHTHRWSFAQPDGAHASTFALLERDGRQVGLAGDQWCPDGSPRVESAWRSGTDLAAALAAHRR